MPENISVFRREIETLKVSESRIEKSRDMKVRHFHDSWTGRSMSSKSIPPS